LVVIYVYVRCYDLLLLVTRCVALRLRCCYVWLFVVPVTLDLRCYVTTFTGLPRLLRLRGCGYVALPAFGLLLPARLPLRLLFVVVVVYLRLVVVSLRLVTLPRYGYVGYVTLRCCCLIYVDLLFTFTVYVAPVVTLRLLLLRLPGFTDLPLVVARLIAFTRCLVTLCYVVAFTRCPVYVALRYHALVTFDFTLPFTLLFTLRCVTFTFTLLFCWLNVVHCVVCYVVVTLVTLPSCCVTLLICRLLLLYICVVITLLLLIYVVTLRSLLISRC